MTAPLLRRLPRRWRTTLLKWIPTARQDWIFAARTAGTSFAAFYLARLIGLHEPQWSMITVFVVAQPLTGMVVAKAMFRVAGTICGASVGVLLVSTLQHTPTLFVLALALWMGLCTAGASLLRNFAAYGVVLAGYTVPIAALPAFGRPEIFDIAEARCLEIVLGIVCAVVASRFIFPRPVRPVLVDRLRLCLADLARYGIGALGTLCTDPKRRGQSGAKRALIAEIQALDQLRSYFIAEAFGRVGDNRRIRHLLGDMLLALSAMVTVETHLSTEHQGVADTLAQVTHALDRIGGGLTEPAPAVAGEQAALLHQLDAVEAAIAARQDAVDRAGIAGLGEATVLAVLADLVDGMSHAVAGFVALRSGDASYPRSARRPAVFASHRAYEAALRHFARSFAAVGAVALFWRLTSWPGTDIIVGLVAAIVGLFATLPNPLKVAVSFAKGVLLAIPCAFLTGQLILPLLPAAWAELWLLPLLGPFLIGAGLMMTRPAVAGAATSFCVFIVALIAPGSPARWEPEIFGFGAIAVVVGLALCVLVFRLVLPPNPRRAIARLIGAMRADVARLCVEDHVPGRLIFESRMYDRINRLLTRLSLVDDLARDAARPGFIRPGKAVGPQEGDGMLAGSLGILALGLEVLRLRRGRARQSLSAEGYEQIRQFLHRLAAMLVHGMDEEGVRALAREARHVAGTLTASPAEEGYPVRLAATLRRMAASLSDHSGFFAARPLLGMRAIPSPLSGGIKRQATP